MKIEPEICRSSAWKTILSNVSDLTSNRRGVPGRARRRRVGTTLHYDTGFEYIAAAAGQPHTWIVPVAASTDALARLIARLLALLLGNKDAQQVDDLLLSSGGGVKFAAHLREPAIHLLLKAVHAPIETIEPRGGLFTERVDRLAVRVHLHAQVGHVAIGPTSQHPGGRGAGSSATAGSLPAPPPERGQNPETHC